MSRGSRHGEASNRRTGCADVWADPLSAVSRTLASPRMRMVVSSANPAAASRVSTAGPAASAVEPVPWKTVRVSNGQQRFLKLTDVAEVLNVTTRQVYALVRSGDLRGIQVGGRNQWRVEDIELEDYIKRQYARSSERDSEAEGSDLHSRQTHT